MPNLGPTELIIIAVVLVLLFGAKKLPDAARSIGRSMRIFKSEVKEMNNDDAPVEQQNQITPGQSQQPQAPQAPQAHLQQPGNPQGHQGPNQPQQ